MSARTQAPRSPAPWAQLKERERAALLAVARSELFGVGTLEVRHRDALDFHEVGVASLRDALALAFLVGAGRAAVPAPAR